MSLFGDRGLPKGKARLRGISGSHSRAQYRKPERHELDVNQHLEARSGATILLRSHFRSKFEESSRYRQ